VFNSRSERLAGGFVEQVDPRCWAKSEGDGWVNVVARFNHLDEFPLGSTKSGTLRLGIDARGLDYEVDLPECREDVLEYIIRGDVSTSSVSFAVFQDHWSLSDEGLPLRTLQSARLLDVSPVTRAAYPSTSVALRGLAQSRSASLEDVVALAKKNQLGRLFTRSDLPTGSLSGPRALADITRKRYAPQCLSGAQARADMMSKRYPPQPLDPKRELVDLRRKRPRPVK
jgi:hypothetical protein